MKKFTLLFLLSVLTFINSFAQFSGMQVTELWKKTDYAWTNAANSRDMTLYNGKLYVHDRVAKKVYVIDAATGDDETPIATGNATAMGAAIAINTKGEMMFNASFATTGKLGISYFDKTTSKIVNIIPDVVIPGYGPGENPARFDYINVYGNRDEGYIISPSVNNDIVCIRKIKDSAQDGAEIMLSGLMSNKAVAGADIYMIDKYNFWISGSNITPILVNLDYTDMTNATVRKFGTVKPAAAASGVAYFRNGGYSFLACAESIYGSMGIYFVSEGPENATLVGSKLPDLGKNTDGAVKHCPIEVETNSESNSATIYIYAPGNGIAAYSVTGLPVSVEGINSNQDEIYAANGNIHIKTTGSAKVEIFSLMGQQIKNMQISDEATIQDLPANNLYLVKVNGKVKKIKL